MIKVIFLFLILFLLGEGLINVLCGCHRKFKKNRKCSRWECPNRKQCQWSKYYNTDKSDFGNLKFVDKDSDTNA